MPMPMASGASPSRTRSSFQLPSAVNIRAAQLRALAASLSLAVGTPNTAKIESPIYLSTVPPQVKISAVMRWWNWRNMVTTAAGALRRLAPPVDVAQLHDVVDGLAHGDFEIAEIDRLGDKIKRAAVHRGAQIFHVAIGRDDDGAHFVALLAQPGEQGQPVHHRHVDVE